MKFNTLSASAAASALSFTVPSSAEQSSAHLRGSGHEFVSASDIADEIANKLHRPRDSFAPIEVNNDDWVDQCAGTFREHFVSINMIARSNFFLVDEPSGLCADALSCAFDKCYGSPEGGSNADDSPLNRGLTCVLNRTMDTYEEIEEACDLPPLNLPSSITFPENAADVVAAVEYAKENGMKISIKSTGHSYTGAHTKAGSLQLNMRGYPKYASGDSSVVECDTADSSNDYEDGDACILATARGKDAYIRVGGGQFWSDVYTALTDANHSGAYSKNYAVAGGAAGSVGAAGGWLQGGGLSTGMERTAGLGVDQILELEVVLSNAQHVRVFPSEWETVDGMLNPQTTGVTALCNANVVADEDEWEWIPCEDLPVAPEDLWKALRGGGGGTYAVVLSVKYQAFEMENKLELIAGGMGFVQKHKPDVFNELVAAKASITADTYEEIRRTYTMFLVDFLFDPKKIGLDRETTLSCGGPAVSFRFEAEMIPFNCWGEGSVWPRMSAAWNETVYGASFASEYPEIADMLAAHTLAPGEKIGLGPFESWGEQMKTFMHVFFGEHSSSIYPEGVVPDSPLPAPVPSKGFDQWCSINLPLGLLESDDEAERDLVFKILDNAGGEHTTGGDMMLFSDGMDAVSPAERHSGQSSIGAQYPFDKFPGILEEYLSAVQKYVGKGEDGPFMGYYEYNHICPDARTPSKSDWTKECEPDEGECFSIQESIWGEELHAELRGIKSAVDPDNMFDCYPCIQPAT